MAGSVNKVILIGNLGRDPEVRSFPNGGKVCNLRIATSENWKDRNTGERREKTEWHSVAIFSEPLVRVAEQYLRKGSKIYIEGQLETRKWQDQSGQDRYSTEVVLRPYTSTLTMLDGRGDNAGGGGGYGGGSGGGGYDQGYDSGPAPADPYGGGSRPSKRHGRRNPVLGLTTTTQKQKRALKSAPFRFDICPIIARRLRHRLYGVSPIPRPQGRPIPRIVMHSNADRRQCGNVRTDLHRSVHKGHLYIR